MHEFDAFISYPSPDKTQADAACAALEAAGVRCWIAPRDVAPGADWAASIVDAIDRCRVMVLIFSSHANQSRQVHREVQHAFGREVPVVPFRIEEVVPEKALAYYMGPVHWLDALTPPFEQHLRKLVATVVSLAGTKPPVAVPVPSVDRSPPHPGPLHPRPADSTPVPAPQPVASGATQAREPPAGSAEPPAAHMTTAAARPLLDDATTIALWTGTPLFAWWLIAAAAGPGKFSTIQWLDARIAGWLILASYCVLVFVHALRRLLGLVRLVGSSQAGAVRFEDYFIASNTLLVLAVAATLILVADNSHAAVAWVLARPLAAIPLFLFAVTICVAMRTAAQSTLERHVGAAGPRAVALICCAFVAVLIAATMVYALVKINANS